MTLVKLTNRAVIKICGTDRSKFLQGLISNDTNKIDKNKLLYGLMLTPQGKYFCDLFLWECEDCVFIDCPADQASALKQKLNMYKLRSDVAITPSEYMVYAAIQTPDEERANKFQDPRHPELGYRLYESTELEQNSFEQYNNHRIELGIPEHGHDLIPDKSIPLECHLEKLGAIDWDKGCYMGQELTARTNYRGLVRKCLFPVKFTNRLSSGAIITDEHNKKVGEVFSVGNEHGIAMIRIAACDSKLTSDSSTIEVIKPGWLRTWLSEKQAELKE